MKDDIITPVRLWMSRFLPGAVDEIGKQTVADIKTRLDIPCPVFHTGSGEHSPEGDPPYRETGSLQDGIAYDLNVGASKVAVTISSSRIGGNPEVPKFLEWGTSRMAARPYMRPARNRGETKVPEILRAEASSV